MKEALKLTIEALRMPCSYWNKTQFIKVQEAIKAGEEALAQPENNIVQAVKAVLKGIDQTECDSPEGWWETSTGAEFGAKKLKYVIGLLAQPEQEPYAWEFAGTIFHDRKEVFDWYERGDVSNTPPLPLYTFPQPKEEK